MTGCSSLQRLPDSMGALQRLTNLQMPQCTALRALPQSIGSLASLATLNAGCLRCPISDQVKCFLFPSIPAGVFTTY